MAYYCWTITSRVDISTPKSLPYTRQIPLYSYYCCAFHGVWLNAY